MLQRLIKKNEDTRDHLYLVVLYSCELAKKFLFQ